MNDYFQRIYDQGMAIFADAEPENFTPNPGTILVRVPPPDEQTKGGLVLPDIAKRENNFGVVLASPEGCRYKPGNLVYFRAFGNEPVPFKDRKDIYLVNYTDDSSSDVLGEFSTSKRSYEAAA